MRGAVTMVMVGFRNIKLNVSIYYVDRLINRITFREQLLVMFAFIFLVVLTLKKFSAAPTPKPPATQSKQLPHYSVVPDIKPPCEFIKAEFKTLGFFSEFEH